MHQKQIVYLNSSVNFVKTDLNLLQTETVKSWYNQKVREDQLNTTIGVVQSDLFMLESETVTSLKNFAGSMEKEMNRTRESVENVNTTMMTLENRKTGDL